MQPIYHFIFSLFSFWRRWYVKVCGKKEETQITTSFFYWRTVLYNYMLSTVLCWNFKTISARNRVGLGLSYRPAQAAWAGGNDSWESILWLLKNLKIPPLHKQQTRVGNLSPAMGRGIDSRNLIWNWVAKLHRLAGRNDNPMPTRFLAEIVLKFKVTDSGSLLKKYRTSNQKV